MDTIFSPLPTIKLDTLEYVMKSDVTSFYMDMMDKQASQFTVLVTVISAIFGLVTLFTLWWNYKGAQIHIKEQINAEREKIEDSLQKEIQENLDEYKEKISQSLTTQVQQAIDEQIKRLEQQIISQSDKINEYQNGIDQKSTKQQAELARLFALYNHTIRDYISSLEWWIYALNAYSKINNDYFVGLATENIVLRTKEIIHINAQDFKNADIDIEECISIVSQCVPDSRYGDKKEILQNLQTIKKTISQS